MNQGRIIVITGSPGTGKTTTASIVAKESDMDKSVHMHTDDFFHYLSKGAIPPHLPESNEQNLVVIEAFLEAAKRYARGGYDVIVVTCSPKTEPLAIRVDSWYTALKGARNHETAIHRGADREGLERTSERPTGH